MKYLFYICPIKITIRVMVRDEITMAKFMGVVVNANSDNYNARHPNTLCYTKEWNWLMPVVHKCLRICHENMLNEWENSFADAFLSGSIDTMVKEVVEFIGFYNKVKKNLVDTK